MLEVDGLVGGVDARFQLAGLRGSVLVLHRHLEGLSRLDLTRQAFDADGFLTGKLEALAVRAFRELKWFTMFCLWQMPHSYAIAMFRMQDYREAGIPVLPVKE